MTNFDPFVEPFPKFEPHEGFISSEISLRTWTINMNSHEELNS